MFHLKNTFFLLRVLLCTQNSGNNSEYKPKKKKILKEKNLKRKKSHELLRRV